MTAVPVVNLSEEKRGDTLDYTITVAGVDLTEANTVIWFTGKLDPGDVDGLAVWQKTVNNGGIVITGPTSAIATLDPADTAALPDDTIVHYDVQVKTPQGRVQTAFEGTISFDVDITQATNN